MSLSNSLIYEGKLEAGNEAVANRRLKLIDGWKDMLIKSLISYIDPNNPIVFVNVDPVLK